MAQPSNASVIIDGSRFDAISAHVGIETQHDGTGMPMIGTLTTRIHSASRLWGKHLGDDQSTRYEKPTEKQQAALKWIVAQLLDAYGLQRTDVYRHPQVSRKNEGEARDAQW